MEMLFMYPWTLVVSRVGVASVIEMFLFLGILLAGVLYAWREGALRWT
jgi:NADH-quinone oxidoreductase subunit A